MNRFTLYLLVVLTVLALTGCGAKEVPAETMAPLAPATTMAPETTEPAPLTNAQLAENTAKDFALAYFAGDTDTMKTFLTEPFDWSLDRYPYDGIVVNHLQLKGIETLDEAAESCVASLEFKQTAESDSYTYLTMEMMKQNGQWKISFYGLEG